MIWLFQRTAIAAAALAALLAACGPAPDAELAATGTLAPSRVETVPSPAPSTHPTGLAYEIPAEWNRVPPASSMRIDQATIPGPSGSAELAVFYFGPGGGGSVEDNLNRWVAQVNATAPPQRESFESGGLKITWIDVTGTLLPSTTGMGPATAQPDSRMLAAVVEGPGGPWFVKATGPAATLAAAREPFLAMLRSMRAAGSNV